MSKKSPNWIKKRAEELDSRHPGSTFAQELQAHCPYLVLVIGPFGNLSSDFKTFVDFIARKRAMQTVALALALAVHRRALVRVLASLLFAAGLSILLIAGAMRCRTAPTRPTTPPTLILQPADEYFRFHGMHVPGA